MRRFLIGLLATIGLLTLIVMIGLGFLVSRFLPTTPNLPDRILLTADWTGELTEAATAPNLLDLELTPPPTVSDIVLALDAAAKDRRVAGLLVKVAETSHGFAVTQELRGAVARLRASGRFAIAYADSFGELSSGNEGYYLASAFERIALQPVGLVGLTGLSAQVPLARDLLASLGVRFEVSRRAEYKTALESLTENQLSEPNREQLGALLDTLMGQLVGGIAQARRLEPEAARELIDRGPFTGQEARTHGLVDYTLYYDQALDDALRRAGGTQVGAVPLADYAERLPNPGAGAVTVALIRASGLIRRGDRAIGIEIAADDLVAAFEEAAEDRAVRAVVLRLDTGGGSAVASETIARAVRRTRAAGKPVIVSMSNAAASGGYWIAMDATRIVAQPATLTGSIGVVAGKPNLQQAWDKLGVRWAELGRGAQADIWSVNVPYSAQGQARVDAIVGALYRTFTRGVARGRDLPQERVQEIARGRVWAGETALELGLVDELGGLDTALAAARRALDLPADAPLRIKTLPPELGPLRAVLHWLRPEAVAIRAMTALAQWVAGGGFAGSPPLTIR